ncbi:MAG: hypothetical protein MUO26_09135, partial [Methanotrichaceae archaeon]|nr:hypothetical protein [Methanotrichaceae archaeon]
MGKGRGRRRLPLGKLHKYIGPVLIVASMLVLFASAFIYLFPSPPAYDSDSSSQIKSPSKEFSDRSVSQQILKVAAVQSGLDAFVNSSSDNVTYVQLENTGIGQLRKIRVVSDGDRVVGVLSQLDPKEKKLLAIRGITRNVGITAVDLSGQKVNGKVSYSESTTSMDSMLNGDEAEPIPKERLKTQSAPSEELPVKDPAPKTNLTDVRKVLAVEGKARYFGVMPPDLPDTKAQGEPIYSNSATDAMEPNVPEEVDIEPLPNERL